MVVVLATHVVASHIGRISVLETKGFLAGVLLVIMGIAVATVTSWLVTWAHVHHSGPSVMVSSAGADGRIFQIEGAASRMVVYGNTVSVAGEEYFPRVEVPLQTLPIRVELGGGGKVEIVGAGGTVIIREYLGSVTQAIFMAVASAAGAFLAVWGLIKIRGSRQRVAERR